MADGIYTGMNGATARLLQLDSISDNLANANTPGFRATRPVFEAVLPDRQKSGEATDKVLAAAAGTGVDMRSGPVLSTGRNMDVRPNPGTFLGVRMASGEVALTRDGRLNVDPDGRVTLLGRPVVGESGGDIFVPPQTEVMVDAGGRILADGIAVDQLATFTMEGKVDRLGPSLLLPADRNTIGVVPREQRRFSVGELEGSNYPVLDAALDLVTAQRAYETTMQAIQTYKRMDEIASGVGKPRG